MRDNHHGMPEILDCYERDGFYFGVVRIIVEDAARAFEFGVEQKGYLALKRILQARPFGSVDAKCRYFFTGSYTRKTLGQEPVTVFVRVEQEKRGKAFEFDCPTSLAANLLWFQELRSAADASALRQVEGHES